MAFPVQRPHRLAACANGSCIAGKFACNGAIAGAQGFTAFGPVDNEADLTAALADAINLVKAGGRALVDVTVIGGYGEK